VLIDRRSHPILQPLLYQVATAIHSPADIAVPIRRVADAPGVFVIGDAASIV